MLNVETKTFTKNPAQRLKKYLHFFYSLNHTFQDLFIIEFIVLLVTVRNKKRCEISFGFTAKKFKYGKVKRQGNSLSNLSPYSCSRKYLPAYYRK